jgi:hypothetical protein
VFVSIDALRSLLRAAGPAAQSDFGRQVGTEVGRLLVERLESTTASSLEEMVEHLGGELALLGLGSLSLERWGRALVLKLDHCPFAGEGAELVGAVIEGAIQRALSRTARAVVIDRADGVVRLAVVGDHAAERVARWVSTGVGYAEALGRLQSQGGEA